jgi:hypothetical protein
LDLEKHLKGKDSQSEASHQNVRTAQIAFYREIWRISWQAAI